MPSQLVEAWHMANVENFYTLDQIPAAHMSDSYSTRTRTVSAQFAHMHNVRTRWMMHMAPSLLGKVKTFPRGAQPTKRELKAALRASEKVIARYLEECEAAGKVKRWKGPPATFLCYLVAHEAHHRGLAMVAMRMCGHRPSKELVHGQWQWGKQGENWH